MAEKDFKTGEGVIYIIQHGDYLLLTKRIKEGSNFKDLYLFPGGHIEDDDESVVEAAEREAKEERGIVSVKEIVKLGTVTYRHPKGIMLTLHVVLMKEDDIEGMVGNMEPEKEELYWTKLEKVRELCVSEPQQKVLDLFENHLTSEEGQTGD